MKEDKFVAKNIEKWHKLEEYNKILSQKGVTGLDQASIKDFAGLYRALSHHLAYARTYFPQSNITTYLNQIIGVSHNYIFVREESGFTGFKNYFSQGAANCINKNKKFILTAFLTFMAGFIFCLLLVLIDESYGEAFFPEISAGDLNLNPTGEDSWSYPFISSYIMTNNIRVCFMSFAFGILAGVGTLYILFYNGMIIGALTAIVIAGSASLVNFSAMILPHGFIELTAIFISGGAGLMIGKGLVIPGQMLRKDSVVKSAKEAAYLIPLIVVMLIIAGLIEGFFTPLALNPVVKLAFAALTLFLMFAYYHWCLKKSSLQSENIPGKARQ